MLAGTPATLSRVREHKEIPINCSNIDRQYYHQEHQHLDTQSNKQTQQQQQQSTKSSRLLSSSISTSSEPPPQQGSSSGSIYSTMTRRNKLSQQHTRFTSHISLMSPTTATSVSDVVTSNTSSMPPPLPMQDKTDIFHLHHIDQTHSTTSSNINSMNTTTPTTTNSQHMKSQMQCQTQPLQQQQHYQMIRGRHKEDATLSDKLDYATSSFTNVDDLTNAIRNKVIVEEDEEDILSSDNTYLY